MFDGLRAEQLPAAIEALLFVSDEPVSAVALGQMLEVETNEAMAALADLQAQLERDGRGIQLLEVAGGWRLYTHPAYHELLERYVLSWDTRKLSAAALEVLAIVAYMQPATRAQISAVRGVSSDGPLNTLIDRGYVREAGTLEAPGNPILYATTKTFLERYGLSSVKELPSLEDFAPDEKTAQLIRERLGASASTPNQVGEAEESTFELDVELTASLASSTPGENGSHNAMDALLSNSSSPEEIAAAVASATPC